MFEYRLFPNKQQQRLLDQQWEECRWLYNYLLAERRTAWEQRQESMRLYDQQATLPALKAERPALGQVNAQVLHNVAVRLDLAFQAPSGCKLDTTTKRLRLHGAGEVKILLHRPIEGTPKTATISRSSTGKRYVCFSCECAEPAPLPETGQQVGIDVGLKTFATLSSGAEIANPRFFRHEEQALAKVQRRLSKEERGTSERARRRRVVARAHERIAWRRGDFTHQHSRRIVNQFDLIAVEDLAVNWMTHTHCLAKSIHDAAWSQFASLLSYKAAWPGRKVVAVNPAYSSQDCSRCGHRKTDLSLADRTYACSCCGVVLDRDLNASLNILALGSCHNERVVKDAFHSVCDG